MKYSVVIPVFNAEKYLYDCVDGILAQNADCEIILVDDGSTDSSPAICDDFSQKNSNIKVIHTPNGGSGKARNTGVDVAQGQYILFVDADDFLSDDFFEKLEGSDVDRFADVVFFTSVKVFPDGSRILMNDGLKREGLFSRSYRDVIGYISECDKFPASCWAKIINRKFYLESGIRMSETLVGEDIDWTLSVVEKARTFDFFEDGIYYYRKNHGTRSSHKNISNVSDQLEIIEKWKKHVSDSEHRDIFMSFLAYQYAMIYPFYGALDKEKRAIYYPKMKENLDLLEYGKTAKLRMIRLAVRIFGVNNAATVLYKYVLSRDKGNLK